MENNFPLALHSLHSCVRVYVCMCVCVSKQNVLFAGYIINVNTFLFVIIDGLVVLELEFSTKDMLC